MAHRTQPGPTAAVPTAPFAPAPSLTPHLLSQLDTIVAAAHRGAWESAELATAEALRDVADRDLAQVYIVIVEAMHGLIAGLVVSAPGAWVGLAAGEAEPRPERPVLRRAQQDYVHAIMIALKNRMASSRARDSDRRPAA